MALYFYSYLIIYFILIFNHFLFPFMFINVNIFHLFLEQPEVLSCRNVCSHLNKLHQISVLMQITNADRLAVGSHILGQ